MNRLRKPQSDFTIIPNALIRSELLSLKAKGLYCLLFSKPDGWVYVEEVLIKESLDGREAFRSGLKELTDAGWLSKVQVRDDRGNFSHTDWHLSDGGSPVAGKPVAGQSPTTNTDRTKTDEDTPSVSPKPKTKVSPRANSGRSIAILLEDLATIPDNLRLSAECKHNIPRLGTDDEWAKFRNHHISARSKHTRIDLCWDTWCRNAAKWQRGSKTPAGGGAGQGGFKRHDPVAAARDRVLSELYGIGPEGHGGSPAAEARDACPFGEGPEAIDAEFVDAGASLAPVLQLAGSFGGSSEDSDVGIAVPLENQ
jgi:hypothetical protein